jgi:hypothetical protein
MEVSEQRLVEAALRRAVMRAERQTKEGEP